MSRPRPLLCVPSALLLTSFAAFAEPAPPAPPLSEPPPTEPDAALLADPTDPALPSPESSPSAADDLHQESIAGAAGTNTHPSIEPPAAALGAPAPPLATDTPPPTVETRIEGAPGKGITLYVGDAFSLNLRSRVQIRYQVDVPRRASGEQGDAVQTVSIGTLRVWLSGHVFVPELTYMVQLALAARDYRDGATSPVYDAFLDWKAHRDLSFRAGQYFVPFDRLRTVREFALQMADRPRPVLEMTLDRDVGIMAYSDHLLGDDSPVAYRIGAFGGGGIHNVSGKPIGGLLVGRLELRPLGPIDDDSEGDLERRPTPRLALGLGAAANWNTNRLRSTTGPTFVGGVTDSMHLVADLVFKWRGFALQAEYLMKRSSTDQITSTSATGDEVIEATRSGDGWVLQSSYTFDPPFEIVARVSDLTAHPGTDPVFIDETTRFGRELGAGLNYYFNQHKFKLQGDWIARMPKDFEFDAAAHAFHVQLDATF